MIFTDAASWKDVTGPVCLLPRDRLVHIDQAIEVFLSVPSNDLLHCFNRSSNWPMVNIWKKVLTKINLLHLYRMLPLEQALPWLVKPSLVSNEKRLRVTPPKMKIKMNPSVHKWRIWDRYIEMIINIVHIYCLKIYWKINEMSIILLVSPFIVFDLYVKAEGGGVGTEARVPAKLISE